MKKNFLVFVLAICLIFPCGILLTACGENGHTHNYEIQKHDDSHHWLECICGERSEDSITIHAYDDDCDDDCNVCNYIRIAPHNFSDEWEHSENKHWHKCKDCPEISPREDHTYPTIDEYVSVDGTKHKHTCITCEYEETFAHNFDEEWHYDDDTGHYHICLDCNEHSATTPHTFDNACDTSCNDCGYTRTITHDYSPEWSSDGTYHWHECNVCHNHDEDIAHNFTLTNNAESHWQVCTNCDYETTKTSHSYVDGLCSECDDIENMVYTYDSSADAYILSSGKAINLTTLIIPKTYDDGVNGRHMVVAIGEEAFFGCVNLTSVTIPASVQKIGEGAFSGCANLTTLIMSNSVTSIGESAFYNCTNLNKVNYLGTIDEWAEISFGNPNSNPIYYANCLYLNDKIVTEVRLSSAKKISAYAFYNCKNITYLTTGGVTTIRIDAFYGCSSLTSFYIGTAVNSIDYNVFKCCPALEEMSVSSYNSDYKVINNCLVATDAYLLVTGCKNSTIPNPSTNGPIRYIGSGAFYGCTSLTSISIPGWITRINAYAFYGCTGLKEEIVLSNVDVNEYAFAGCTELTSVSISFYSGNSVNDYYIDDYAFYGCSKLTNVTIGNSTKTVGEYAFANCTSLTEVTIKDSITTISSAIFSGCSSLTKISLPSISTYGLGYIFGTKSYTGGVATEQQYSNTSRATYYIPETLRSVSITNQKTIQYGAFYNCSNLTSITMVDGTWKINDYAFYNCSSIASITIPTTVESIGFSAFYGCIGLTNIVFPESLTTIDRYAFNGCSKLTNVTISSELTGSVYSSSAFIGTNVTNISFTNGVKKLGSWFGSLFANCSNIIEIILPKQIYKIGECTFKDFTSLKSVTLQGVSTVGDKAFSGCTNLTNITLGTSITNVGDKVLHNCTNLSNIYIDGDVAGNNKTTEWFVELLDGITGINVIITDNVATIGNKTFDDCTAITSVSIGNNVTTIGNYAFYRCTGLTKVTIGESVTTIGDKAFDGCTSLTNIIMPESVTTIGSSAFYGCTGLKSVTFGDGLISIENHAFYGCTGLSSIIIPNNVTTIESYAFWKSTNLISVTLGSMVASIGTNAFYECYKLIEIYNLSSLSITTGSSDNGYVARYAEIVYTDANDTSKLTTDSDGFIIYDTTTLVGYVGTSADITLPINITAIRSYAFYNCTQISGVTIQKALTSENVGSGVFFGCTSLTNVTLTYEEGTTNSWFKKLFNDCSGLNVNITSNITSIENSMFSGCTTIASITLSNTVETIGNNAFYGCTSLTEITIPDSVTTIGYSAFSGCTSLTSIIIPEKVTTIGFEAFSGCTSLTEITIPSSVTTINNSAFKDCTAITKVNITDINKWASIAFAKEDANPLYANGANVNLYLNGTLVTSVEIGTSTTNLAYSFCGYSKLTSVTILEGITTIGKYTFYNCTGLTSVTISSGVTSIADNAFGGCTGLTEISIPSSVTTIENDAFRKCTSITDVYITDINKWANIEFGFFANPLSVNTSGNASLYLNGELVTDVELDNTVTSSLEYSFYNYLKLTSITIPSSVTTIGISAFSGCTGLKSVTISSGVTSIGNYAFNGCTGLTEITIPGSVTTIGSNAFSGCTGLTEITIPGSVTTIGSNAFSGCTGLKSVTISSGVTSIGNYAFNGCTSLTEITIPGSVTTIGSDAFYDCTGLKSVTLLDGVTTIGNGAFMGCSSLTSIIFTESVTTIERFAFYCDNLKYIYYIGTAENFDECLSNDYIFKVVYTCYFYSATQPTDTTGNYWYYADNGDVAIW